MQNSTPTKKARNSIAIDSGLRTLCARQRPGQVFTLEEIAAECDCARQNIRYIERKAMSSLLHALIAADPTLLNDLFGQAKVEEITAQMRDGTFCPKDRNAHGGQTYKRVRKTVVEEVFLA